MSKIYDFFMYSDYQPEILELRLETLANVIDYFIISESKFSHSGQFKGENKWDNKLLEKFKDKIIRIDVPYFGSQDPWRHEQFQREHAYEQIKDTLKDSDIILCADNDEIPNPEILKEVTRNLEQPTTFCGQYYMFAPDLYGRESIDGFVIKNLWKRASLNDFRSHRTNFKYKDYFKHIPNSSWHYSTVATVPNIVRKLKEFAHVNDFLEVTKTDDYIKDCIKYKRGDYKNNDTLKLVTLNESNAPKYLLENKEKFKHLFYENYI